MDTRRMSLLLGVVFALALVSDVAGRRPDYKWYQRRDKLYITVDMALDGHEFIFMDETSLHIKGRNTAREDVELELEFLKEINIDESSYKKVKKSTGVLFEIEKVENGGDHWPRLLAAEGDDAQQSRDTSEWMTEKEEDRMAEDMEKAKIEADKAKEEREFEEREKERQYGEREKIRQHELEIAKAAAAKADAEARAKEADARAKEAGGGSSACVLL
eukprot:GFYU01012390.1.p1 GENE.GFYU01012390.1~~GFYU01012390.1.p1  ORF type:complete len:217 (-),score=84.30 GFYU01012390.1:94-744(-)